jgi:hypothetical protein
VASDKAAVADVQSMLERADRETESSDLGDEWFLEPERSRMKGA